MNRRSFLTKAGIGIAGTWAGAMPMQALAAPDTFKLTILHTNDVHSRIEPFPMDGSRFQGMGGVERRERIIRKVRSEEEHVLLLDAGDIFQGTPYFNMFDGELEIKLMNKLGYDASVPGNHDFDKGAENLAKQLKSAEFKMLISNYGLQDNPIKDFTSPWMIIEKGPLKIGILGTGINLYGLVTPSLYGSIEFLDTVKEVNRYAAMLKQDEKCDLVICLSHLGFRYKDSQISDCTLAAASENLDLIIGGHTHTFLDEPEVILNKIGSPVVVNQVGWAGIVLGRLDFYFEKNKRNRCFTCRNQYLIS
jgi:5'-nucleotidase